MKKKALLILATVLSTADASAWRCGNSLVEEQDLKQEVQQNCGTPTARYFRRVPYELEVGDALKRRRYQTIEFWVYLTGRNSFARILFFEDGRLQKIRTGDYGDAYNRDADQCKQDSINTRIHQTQPELELRCGEPDASVHIEEYSEPVVLDDSSHIMRDVVVYEWLYFKEDQAFVYRFHNGILKWKGEVDRDRYDSLF